MDGGGAGGCGRVVHLEFLDVFKESGHLIKSHLSIQNFYNLMFKIVHPEVGGTENKLDSTVLLFIFPRSLFQGWLIPFYFGRNVLY
ncbi:hypothetical protein IMY05_017G0042600 [Salix suchowensis]|nr:hypothetical protein IMY05_017G0042600 [Salix suchowensis]